jgi:hypothetical protein
MRFFFFIGGLVAAHSKNLFLSEGKCLTFCISGEPSTSTETTTETTCLDPTITVFSTLETTTTVVETADVSELPSGDPPFVFFPQLPEPSSSSLTSTESSVVEGTDPPQTSPTPEVSSTASEPSCETVDYPN